MVRMQNEAAAPYLLVTCDFADPLDALPATAPLIRRTGVASTGAPRHFLLEPRSTSSRLSAAESLGGGFNLHRIIIQMDSSQS